MPVEDQLGRNQKHWLQAIQNHGGRWFRGAGFYFRGDAYSANLCDTLVRRGLLEKLDGCEWTGPSGHVWTRTEYRLTEAGAQALIRIRVSRTLASKAAD